MGIFYFMAAFNVFIRASIEGYPIVFESGREIISARVFLGQNERSSNCEVVLADPTGAIGEALIKHSLESGGIQALPSPKPVAPVGASNQGGSVAPGTSTALTTLTPERRAFLDVLAYAEGADYNIMFTGRTFSGNQHPRQIQCSGSLCSDAAGRYQFLSTTWDSLGLPDFSPANQDLGAIKLIERRGGLGYLDNGQFEQAVNAVALEWASMPGSPYGQPTKTMAELRRLYDERLQVYRGGQPATVPEKAVPATTTQAAAKPTATPTPVFKGSKLFIEVSTRANNPPYLFTFFHQGTETDQDGVTKITGQGIRWVLNRRRRNEGHTNKSLRQLAEEICKSQGLTLDWRSGVDPQYEYVDQSGISDYQLLLREAENAGLFVSEAEGKLTVKTLDNLVDINVTLQPGLNLISWKVADRPVDTNNAEGSSLEPQANKYDLDPVTGQFRQKQVDVDKVADKSVTGKAADTPTGKLKPGQDATTTISRQRVKRVKGLPSTFVIPTSEVALGMQPLDAVRTTGLPGVLSRIWLVDGVAHNFSDGTTVIDCYSPVEVIDTTSATLAPGQPPTSNPGGYIYPTRGSIVTDVRRWRSATRYHHGVDLAGSLEDPTYAAQSGVVTLVSFDPGGYGNYVDIRHPDGNSTRYAHLNSVAVSVGQQVTQGQNIGGQGTTGGSTGIHLHFEVRDASGQSQDLSYVGLRNPSVGETI